MAIANAQMRLVFVPLFSLNLKCVELLEGVGIMMFDRWMDIRSILLLISVLREMLFVDHDFDAAELYLGLFVVLLGLPCGCCVLQKVMKCSVMIALRTWSQHLLL